MKIIRGSEDTNRMGLDFPCRVLYFLGLWPSISTKETKTFEYHLRRWFIPFEMFRITYSLIFHVIMIETLWNQTMHRVHELNIVGGMLATVLKVSVVYFQRERLEKCYRQLAALNGPEWYVDDHCDRVKQKAERFCDAFGKFTLTFATFVPLTAPTFLYRQIRAAYDILSQRFHPFENHFLHPLVEWPTITLLLCGTFDLLLLAAADNACFGLVVRTTAQFHILRYKIENLRELVEKKLNKDTTLRPDTSRPNTSAKDCVFISLKSEDVGDLKTGGESDELDDSIRQLLDDGVVEDEHDGGVKQEVLEEDTWKNGGQGDFETEMEKYLGVCVAHHQMLLELCQEIQHLFKKVFAAQICLAIMMSMIGLYIKIILRITDFDGDVAAEFGFLFAGIIEFFCFCVLSDLLTQSSTTIYDAAYSCDWIEATEGFKRSLRLILSRTIKPVVLKAAGIPLLMPTFKKIVKASYYINSILTKIMDGENLIKSIK